MRIFILANQADYVYKLRKELLLDLVDNNDVYVLCAPHRIMNELVNKGCIFIPIIYDRHSINIFKEFKILFVYYNIFQRVRPDVVLAYTIKPIIYGCFVSSLLKIPCIPTVTGLGTALYDGGIVSKIVKKMYKIALKRAKCVVFQNQANLDYMVKNHIVTGRYILVNGSGVNTEQFSYIPYPSNDNIINILFIGRLMRDKGILELFDAAKILHDKGYRNIKIQVIGFCEDDFKKQLESLNLSPNIELCGYQENVKPYIENAHAVVLPSYHEGMSNSLLEAASCGRPLIASDIPGCREIIDNYQTGILCKPRDVDSLVSALTYFIELPYEEKRQMGINGRKKVEKSFDRKTIVAKYKEIIYGDK